MMVPLLQIGGTEISFNLPWIFLLMFVYALLQSILALGLIRLIMERFFGRGSA